MNNRKKIILEDMEQTMTYKLLETASDKSDIEARARKRGLVVPSPDIGLFRGSYTKADEFNRNGSFLSSKEIAGALQTLVLKPVTHNHHGKEIVGIILDAEFNDKEVIVWGAIYKDNYSQEHAKFKEDFESGDIGLSYEIYGDKIFLGDGKYKWENVFFSGCGMLDKGIRPAVHGSKILEFAMTKEIGADDVSLIICNHCGLKFDISSVKTDESGATKCPKCKETVGLNVQTQATSEITCKCPNCGNNAWNKVEDKNEAIVASCTMCDKKYEFEIEEFNKNVPKLGINAALEGKAECLQCGNIIKYPIWANREKSPLICRSCGLRFIHTRKNKDVRFIVKSIKEFKEEHMNDLQKAFSSVEKVEDVTDEMIQTFEAASDEDKAILEDKVKEIASQAIEAKKLIDEETAKMFVAKEEVSKEVASKEVLKNGIKKLALEVMNLREDIKVIAEYEKELASVKELNAKNLVSIKENNEKEIAQVKDSYKAEAKLIHNRKNELGEYAEAMSDDEIMNDKDYKIAQLSKELAMKKVAKTKEEAQANTTEIVVGSNDLKEETEEDINAYNKRLKIASELLDAKK